MLHVEIEDVIGLFDLLVRKKLLEQPSLVRMLEHSFENITEPVQVDRILLSPLPWVKKIPVAKRRISRLGVAAGVLLLLLAVSAGAFCLASADWAMGHPSRR